MCHIVLCTRSCQRADRTFASASEQVLVRSVDPWREMNSISNKWRGKCCIAISVIFCPLLSRHTFWVAGEASSEVSGAREHEGNGGFYTGIVDQRAGGMSWGFISLDQGLIAWWCRTRASSKWNCLKHVQTWRRRIILVLGQRAKSILGDSCFDAFWSKVCHWFTTEIVDACICL